MTVQLPLQSTFITEMGAFLKICGAVPRFGGSQKNPFEFLDLHYTGIM